MEELLRRQQPTRGDAWLELLIAAFALFILIATIVGLRRVGATVVVTSDVRKGERLAAARHLSTASLPPLPDGFEHESDLRDAIATHDLPRGTVLRWSDVARPQAVATTELRRGEALTSTTVAFKLTPYVPSAITDPKTLPKRAKTFLATGSVITSDLVLPPGATPSRPVAHVGEVEVPVNVFAGDLDLPVGAELIVVAAADEAPPITIPRARILTVNRTGEKASLTVAMPRDCAMRFAALHAPEVDVMRRPIGFVSALAGKEDTPGRQEDCE